MDISSHQTKLEEEKTRLEEELATVGRRNPSNQNDWEAVPESTDLESDPNDRADQMRDYSDNEAILTDLEIRLNQVTAALKRIEEGTYGICRVSGKPIEEDRLEADPAADTSKEFMNS